MLVKSRENGWMAVTLVDCRVGRQKVVIPGKVKFNPGTFPDHLRMELLILNDEAIIVMITNIIIIPQIFT